MFIGMIVNAFYKPNSVTAPGIKFTSKKILKFAIILLGASLNIRMVLTVGRFSLTVMVFTQMCIRDSVGPAAKEEQKGAASCPYVVLKTDANFNNELGLSLTVFRLREEDEMAVLAFMQRIWDFLLESLYVLQMRIRYCMISFQQVCMTGTENLSLSLIHIYMPTNDIIMIIQILCIVFLVLIFPLSAFLCDPYYLLLK